MSRRTNVVCLSLALLGLAFLSAACGGSGAVTGSEPAVPTGSAILQGSVAGGGDSLRVGVVGTSLSGPVDEDGQFVLSSVPSGNVTLRFEGGGVDARLTVPGLQNGLVTSINVTLTGSTARINGTPTCAPTADTFFSGLIEQFSPPRIVVAGRPVDTSEIQKVWRGERRIQLSDLQVGEKVKVWGVLRGDGVVVAEEIAALTTGLGEGADVWVSFTGTVESVSSAARGTLELHANPYGGYYPTVVVAGKTVQTNDKTKFGWSSGATLDPRDIKAGQSASVEGWKKADGTIRATSFRVEGNAPSGPTWVTFKGRVDAVAAAATGLDVHASPYRSYTISGRKVKSDPSTVVKWSDGSPLDPYAIVVGDVAYVEGWDKPEGYVLATKIVVDKR